MVGLMNGVYGYQSVFSNILKINDDADIETFRLALTSVEIE